MLLVLLHPTSLIHLLCTIYPAFIPEGLTKLLYVNPSRGIAVEARTGGHGSESTVESTTALLTRDTRHLPATPSSWTSFVPSATVPTNLSVTTNPPNASQRLPASACLSSSSPPLHGSQRHRHPRSMSPPLAPTATTLNISTSDRTSIHIRHSGSRPL